MRSGKCALELGANNGPANPQRSHRQASASVVLLHTLACACALTHSRALALSWGILVMSQALQVSRPDFSPGSLTYYLPSPRRDVVYSSVKRGS